MKHNYQHVTIEERAGVVVAYLSGVINARTAEAIQTRLETHMISDCPLLLDLSAVDFLSSAGLSMFVALQRRLVEQGGQLVLVSISEPVKNTLSWVGAVDFIPIETDLSAGLDYLAKGK